MNEDFKINIFFNEDGEELEKILSNFFINILKTENIKINN